MSIFVGGIGSSHAPSLAYAFNEDKGSDPEWKDLFENFSLISQWLINKEVDTLVFVYNDHLNNFEFDSYPTFALGVQDFYEPFPEASTSPQLEIIQGNSSLSWHIAENLINDEFDPNICQEMRLDHGVTSVLPYLQSQGQTLKIVPIHVNVMRSPLPLPLRLWKLGQSIYRAIVTHPDQSRVAIISTGGLSHHLQGKHFGFTNPAWDKRFFQLLIENPEVLANATHDDFIYRGGSESVEMMMWLAMRGCVYESNKEFKTALQFYKRSIMTGYGLLALEMNS